jgi:hypothetical protein
MKSWRTWNWWKIAFFVVLFAFEITRELYVIELSQPTNLAAIKVVSHFGDITHAEGKWVRNDEGDRLSPMLVSIDCNRAEGTCIEASTRVFPGGYVATPTVETYAAQFGADTIEYQNKGVCTNYSVRIDLKAQEAYQTRTRTGDQSATCAPYEARLSARLGSGWDDLKPPFDGHFVPIMSMTKVIVDLFS